MRKVGLGETGETAPTGRVRPQGGRNVLMGGGTSNTTVWFVYVGPFGVNGEEDRRGKHRVTQTDPGEVSVADTRRGVGDARGGISAGSSGNAVGDDLYRETVDNRGTVGGVTNTIRSVCRGEGILRGWTKEGGLVELRFYRETTLGRLGRNLAGG